MTQRQKKTEELISLLFKIDALLENNKKIRSEIIKLLAEEEVEEEITDILGIKVYIGKDYINPEDQRIKIGEDLGQSPVLRLEQSCLGGLEEYSLEVQDCGGNFVSVKPIDIPKSLDLTINRTF